MKQAELSLAEATRKVAALKRKIVAYRRVGVWTDDYSNLLSVFLMKDEE